MKKRIFKRTIAVILTVCIALSTFTFSVSAGSFKTFGINKLYTTGFLVAGKVLTEIAQSTGCEEFEKIASFINVWVCGGNPTTQTLAEIEALCQEILAEVKKIEQKQDSYATYFATKQAQDKYDALVKEMNSVWTNDVDNVLAKEGINIAMLDYFEYEDMVAISDSDTNQHIGYLAAANCYKTNTPDKYSKYYSFDDVQDLREDLFYDFCSIYGSMPSDADTLKEKADVLFNSTAVDIKFQNAIRTLSNNINKADSYSDICAQVAYQSMPNLADQYEFVSTGMNKQFMQVILVEMLYQEYLSMRGEYLEKCYPDDTAKWNSYRKDGIEKLEACNEELLGIMETRVSKPLQLDTNITLPISKYVKPEDVSGVTLKNTEFVSKRDAYDNPNVYYHSSNMTDANYTKEYMDFFEIAVPTSNGVKLFYLFDGDKDSLKTINLVHKFAGTAGVDWYGATCDAYNFRHCTYSDGQNTFSNPVDPSGDAVLFQTDSFALYGSTPYAYLSEYLDYVPADKGLYRMYAKSFNDTQADGWLTDDHMIYDALDMKDSYVGFDTSLNLIEKVDAKVVYDKGYNRKGYDKATYDSYFNVILTQDSNDIKHKLSYSVTGNGKADMYITKSDGTKVSSGTTLTSGEDLTLWIKADDRNNILESLDISRYNDYQNPNTPTSTQNLLGKDEFSNLKIDEATGYYKLDFTMPYSDTKLELTTEYVEPELDKDENGSYIINDYDDLCDMAYLVNSGDETYTKGSYVLVNNINCSKESEWNTPIGTYAVPFEGTFDGQGYTISGLHSTKSTDKTMGLFGAVENGTVKNVNLADVDFNIVSNSISVVTKDYDMQFGAVCGEIYSNAVISNCTVSGNIDVTNALEVGGICGYTYNSTIEKCINNSNIKSNAEYIGGICGSSRGPVNNCANTGSIECTDAYYCGGIVGGSFDYLNVVKNSYNTGTISGTSKYIKSISGCESTVENCFYLTSGSGKGTVKTEEQFNSGEVAYLLNNGVTDGTQAWYQNIGGENADTYPVLDSTHKTVYKSNDTYTNGDLIGDMNRDGVIDQNDLTLLSEYLVRKAVLTADEVKLGDVNGDGKTCPNDSVIMKAYVNQDGTDYANTGKYGINTMPTDALLVGDVNFDDVIDQSDADLLSQFNVEMVELTDEQKKAGDIDLDGHISSKDMAEINKYLAIISSGKTYTGNIGKYSYQGFDMTITGGVTSTTPTEPSTEPSAGTTVPSPDNSDANSLTSDSTTSGKTDNNAIQTGNPVNCFIILSALVSGLVLMFTFRRYKNK